ncbi:MAG: hypothetical protein NTX48_07170 [Planctomycetales bacterium]|nr:hypothetical protein [Planctomycetales bacterium]
MLIYSGVPESTCRKCGEFSGIDWGEETLLKRELFMTQEDIWEMNRIVSPQTKPAGVGSATGVMPGGEAGRGGGLIYQNR